MKKIYAFLLFAFGALGMSAAYNAMEFTTETGEKFTIGMDNLIISVDGQSIKAVNGENTELNFDVASLASMQFVEFDNSGVDQIRAYEGGVVLFRIDGSRAGSFGSLEEARASLEGGVYIVRLADGGTLKIILKK